MVASPRVEPPKARKLEAPPSEAPLVTIRASSEHLGVDFAMTIPATKQRVENFSLLLFDLASAINSGQVLDMRQENGMKSFEARLSRNLWNRDAQQRFYTELAKVYEQQAMKMHEMRLSYYRELDHLRDQLGIKSRDHTFTMMEDVHFFNPDAYRIPAWREIADLLEVERRPVGGSDKQVHVRYVPVHVLCKACRAKFSDYVPAEPKDVGVQAPDPDTSSPEECSCSSDAAEERMTEEPSTTVAGISRWAQTEISMEQDAHRESRSAQTESAEPATMSSRQSSPTPAELAGSAELASATTAAEPAASTSSSDAPGFPAQQVPQEEEGCDSEQSASNRHLREASLETATASCGAARRGRARAGKSPAPEMREEDFDLLLDIEAAFGAELPAAPTRRRRSEPWARLRPQRQGGFTSLSDVPDVPVSIDGSAAAGGLEHEDILATCPDAMTEEEGLLLGVQLHSCDAGEDRWDRSESDSESLGLPLTLEEGPWIRGLVLEGLEASETNSPQESREAMHPGDSSAEGAIRSRSSVLAASQIEIRLDASSSFECRDSRSQPLREGHALRHPGSSGSGPLEARDSSKKAPNALRSPRRRPTLEHATPETRRRPSGGELGATLRQEGQRACRASSKESRSATSAKNQEGCASCPLSGRWTGQGEQQIRIRSFNFEMNDATGSATLEDARKTSPRTFLPKVAVAKTKEALEAKASLPEAPERSQTLERSLSPSSDRRSTSPCILPSNVQAPTRPAVPQSARGRPRRTSLTVPCSRAPATSMSLLSGDELAESPRAPLHKNHSTSLDSSANGPAESVGSGGEAASSGFNSYEPVAASALPMASRDRQKFPSLLTATSIRPKTDQSEV